MNIVYIMRGIQGSGKSTVARQLAGERGVIHSTDNFFMVNGQFQFNPKKLQEYHDANFKAFCQSLRAGIEIVICDNTNSQPWHFDRYVKAAEDAEYMVAFVIMPHPDPAVAAKRNIHNVPEEVIRRTLKEWKD